MSTQHAHYLFISALIFAPLAFGTVDPWSIRLLEIIAFSSLLLVAIKKHISGSRFLLTPGAVPLLALLCYMLVQCIPIPQSLMKLISPSTFIKYSDTLLVVNPDAWLSLSFNVMATFDEFIRYSAYAAIYILSVQSLARSKRLKDTVLLIVWIAAAIALIGIIGKVAGNDKVLWVRENPWGLSSMGPYLNKNHFAGLMAMLFPVAFSLFVAYRPRVSYGTTLQQIREVVLHPSTHIHVLLALASMLIFTSIALSLSRAGLISAALGFVIFSTIQAYSDRRIGISALAFIVSVTIAICWLGWEPIMSHFISLADSTEMSLSNRIVIWKDTLSMFKDHYLTGVGFGAFNDTYPYYRTLPGKSVLGHAHNDFLEFAAEGGIVGVLLAATFIFKVLWHAITQLMQRKDRYSICLTAGGLSGLAAAIAHSTVEFNMHIGANALYFFVIAGLMVSASSTRHLGRLARKSYLERTSSQSYVQIAMYATAILVLVTIAFGISAALANFHYVKGFVNNNERIHSAELASNIAPLNAGYKQALARVYADSMRFEDSTVKATEAISLLPLEGRSLMLIASLSHINGDTTSAERLYISAIKYSERAHEAPVAYGTWLLSQERNEEAIKIAATAMMVEPRISDVLITTYIEHGVSPKAILDSLPERAYPYISLARITSDTGIKKLARDNALIYIAGDELASQGDFFNLYSMYVQQEDTDKALTTMRIASEAYPYSMKIRLALAALYEKLGMQYRALDEYRAAASIDSTDINASEGIMRLRTESDTR